MLAKNDIKVGLDIGSSQIHVIVSERDDDYNLHLIGVGTGPSAGLRRGVIVDMDSRGCGPFPTPWRMLKKCRGALLFRYWQAHQGAHISSPRQ